MCPGVASSSSFQVVSVQGEEACKGVVVREAVSVQRVTLCKGCQCAKAVCANAVSVQGRERAKGNTVQRVSACKGCECVKVGVQRL